MLAGHLCICFTAPGAAPHAACTCPSGLGRRGRCLAGLERVAALHSAAAVLGDDVALMTMKRAMTSADMLVDENEGGDSLDLKLG